MTKLNFSHLPLQRIFKVFDSDGSGNVDYKEFLIGLSKFRLKGEQALKCKGAGGADDSLRHASESRSLRTLAGCARLTCPLS